MFDQRHLEFGLLVCAIVLIPGPKTFFSMDTFLANGRLSGCRYLAGTVGANFFLGTLTLLLLSLLGNGLGLFLQTVCWGGVTFIGSLGIKQFVDLCLARHSAPKSSDHWSHRTGAFVKGFALATANPKAIICMASVIPHYILGSEHCYHEVNTAVAGAP